MGILDGYLSAVKRSVYDTTVKPFDYNAFANEAVFRASKTLEIISSAKQLNPGESLSTYDSTGKFRVEITKENAGHYVVKRSDYNGGFSLDISPTVTGLRKFLGSPVLLVLDDLEDDFDLLY